MRTWMLTMAVVSAALGCGPITASTAISRAEEELRTALLANAESGAPYEYTQAEMLLRMARECDGHAEFQAASIFAQRSEKFAQEGKQNTPRNLRQRELREAFRKQAATVPPVLTPAPGKAPAPAAAPAAQPGNSTGGKR